MQIAQGGSLLHFENIEIKIGARQKLDQSEKSNIAFTLSSMIGEHEDAALVNLSFITSPRVPETTFDNAQEFARVALLKFLETEDYLFLTEAHSLPTKAVVCVDEYARLSIQDQGTWRNLTNEAAITIDMRREIGMLADCTEQTGGYVFSGDLIGVEQWLRFHGYTLPVTVADVRQLVTWLEFKLPESPTTGDYHELLLAPADSPFHLSLTDRETIKKIVKDTTRGRVSLLQHLVTPDFISLPANQRLERATFYLEHFLQTAEAGALGINLHDRLGWHLDDNPETARRQIKCMVASAMILDLGFEVERHARVIAGFHLYHPDNASKTPSQVVTALEWQLVREAQLPPLYAPLAAILLLACAAPQFLVRQVPAELTAGKPGWVIVSRAVNLIELTAPGASRLMTYEQIKAFSELAPISTAQHALHELATITPIIQWAMLNGVLPEATGNEVDVDAFTTAASRFSQYVEALNEVETGIAIIPPDRRELALQELKRVLPDGPYLEQRVYKANFDLALGERNFLEWINLFLLSNQGNVTSSSRIGRLRVSILDLYMSGDLVVNGELTDKFITVGNLNPPPGAFTRLGELKPVDVLFDKAFEQYHLTLNKTLFSILKMAVSNLPERDRTMIANGLITLYTVRKSVNPLNPFQETQRQRNEAKGRYGIILGCQHGKAFRCYELFPLRGLCRERPEFVDILRSSGVVYEEPSLSYDGVDTDFQPKRPEQPWPLDFDAYLKGNEPKQEATSSVVVEKLTNFLLASDETHPVPLFFSRAFDALAEGIWGNHPVASRDELYASLYAPTELQKIRTENAQLNEAAINVIVPFKKCIEDIRSGDAPRVSEGIGGCILDGLALLGLVVGFGATIAGIVAKTTSTTAKVLSIAKAGAHFAASIFNPLDGLPTLAIQSGRLAKKGALLLSRRGLNVVETATGQLRRLTGSAQSYDLMKVAQKSELFQGTWKATDSLGDPVDLLALQRNSDWYALNLRVGGAWGPKLKNLKLSDFPPLRRLLGRTKSFSYAKVYVQKAQPLAKAKLDSALTMLSDIDNGETRVVLKHIFGSDSDEVFSHVQTCLHEMRSDLNFVTLDNIAFKKGSKALAKLRLSDYLRWKKNVENGAFLRKPAKQFVVIYPEGLDEYYRMVKYDDGRIADVLVHEMAHGAPGTLDLYYGRTKEVVAGPADMDVAGLLELAREPSWTHHVSGANPHLGVVQQNFMLMDLLRGDYHALAKRHPALLNADSYSLAVSLLDQARNQREAFLLNLARIEEGVKKIGHHGYIDGAVQLKLAKASF